MLISESGLVGAIPRLCILWSRHSGTHEGEGTRLGRKHSRGIGHTHMA